MALSIYHRLILSRPVGWLVVQALNIRVKRLQLMDAFDSESNHGPGLDQHQNGA